MCKIFFYFGNTAASTGTASNIGAQLEEKKISPSARETTARAKTSAALPSSRSRRFPSSNLEKNLEGRTSTSTVYPRIGKESGINSCTTLHYLHFWKRQAVFLAEEVERKEKFLRETRRLLCFLARFVVKCTYSPRIESLPPHFFFLHRLKAATLYLTSSSGLC